MLNCGYEYIEICGLFGVGKTAGDTRGGETPGGGGFATTARTAEVLRSVGLVKRRLFCARKVVGVW